MRPPLVALDFHERTARRYWRKPLGGYMIDNAAIEVIDDPERFLAEVEAFRLGPEKTAPVPAQPEAS